MSAIATNVMKKRLHKGLMLAGLMLAVLPGARAQFSVPWFVIAGGGGTASNGAVSVTGTFGQWDAAPQTLTNGNMALTGGFWSYLRSPAIVPPAVTIFSDTFTGNTVNTSNWIVSGDTVFQTNGTLVVSNAALNNGGVLTSVPIAVNATGLITITRNVTVHPAASTLANYPGTNFLGQFTISIGTLGTFSVNYADWDYDDGVTYMSRYGFFLARDGASPILIADQADVSGAIAPLFDTQFAETVAYNPTNGNLSYSINGALQTNFDVGILPATTSPTMTLSFNAFGLGTGDDQAMQDFVVTQAPQNVPPAPAIALSGNFAFGNVAVGTTATNILTISNSGTATLDISNITVPAGFSVGLTNAAIVSGGTTNVPVIFTPTSSTNYYAGVLTVVSDSGSGANTIPVSGFVTTGTLELSINTVGGGTVTPNDNKKTFGLNKKITLKAVPKTGFIFDGWSGSIVTSSNPLVFNITNSMVLEATFVASPFGTAVAGVYDGLFSASNVVAAESSGMIKALTVTTKGTYSGTLILAGANHAISGTFNSSGAATSIIKLPAKQGGNLIVALNLALAATPPVLTGTVSGTNGGVPFVSDILAFRASKVGTAEYTMLFETSPDLLGDPSLPPGYGYALIAQKSGNLALSGALADGTAISQSVPVTEVDEVPIYDSLYTKTGLVTGWLTLTNNTLTGTLDWIKKAAAKPTLYTAGFTNELIAHGAIWVNQTPAITLPAATLDISGGSLATNLTYDVTVTSKNAVAKATGASNNPPNSLTGTINPKTGLLTITFGTGVGKTTITGKGAALQATTNAGGFFVTKTNSGTIILQ
jgi:hypothetical protein